MSQAILTTWREVLSPGDSTWLRFLIKFARAPVLNVLAIYLRYFRLPIESLLILACVVKKVTALNKIMENRQFGSTKMVNHSGRSSWTKITVHIDLLLMRDDGGQ